MEHHNLMTDTAETGPDLQAIHEIFYHDQAVAEMCDELCRLAREIRRQVREGRPLPALGALTAVAPLQRLLSGQLQTRLVRESTELHAGQGKPSTETDPQNMYPGYL